jgi:pyruvate dehydrogenase E1 component alpha subunit
MADLTRTQLVDMYRKMLEIRFFEDKVFELYGQNMVPGTIHLYAGEEAVAVGVCTALRKDDYITSTHRGHGHCIAKGADLGRTMAEILGKKTGYCKGKGGSMHIADFKIGMLGATAVVGAGLPIAVGAALSADMRKTGQVVACFFGDGASNQGTFHESLNLAALWKLPIVFVCENNLYAMGTSQSRAMAIENISDRAAGYGIFGVTVDGNSILDVYDATAEAVKRARNGAGPTLLECKTYRRRGHSRVDSAKYRSKEEVEEWLARDPIAKLSQKLLEEGGFAEEDLRKIEGEVKAEIEKAAKFATNSGFPPAQDALTDVYA